MTERTRLDDWVDYFFSPPFKGLPTLAWGYFVFSFLAVSSSAILHGSLPDSDDYLYLVRALDLLHGQGWFDTIEHRMNPPDGTYIHFSNILSAVYAAPIFALRPLFGETGAATVVAAFMPPFYLLILFAVLHRVAAHFVDAWGRVSAFIALFATMTMFQFTPGHVDHHGLEIIFEMLAVLSFLRMAQDSTSYKWPIVGGVVLALALAIALEILPIYILIVAWIGLWSAIKGGRAAYTGLVFGLVLAVASIGFLLLTRDQPHLMDTGVMYYSVVYVVLAAGAFLCFAGVALVARMPSAIVRCGVGGALAAGLGIAFLDAFPALKVGPYGAMDASLAKLMFDNIGEALPMVKKDGPIISTAISLMWPGMAAASAFYFMWKERKQNLWPWSLLAALIVVPTLLAMFYQVRFLTVAQAFSVPALVAMLRAGLTLAARKHTGCKLCAVRVGMVMIVSAIPAVLLPAMLDARSFSPGVVFFPNQSFAENPCDLRVVSEMLALPVYYGDRPRTIVNMIDFGPELLFRTPHKVLSAPYHLNVSGNIDAVKFFGAADPEEAHSIARARGIDLVLMCKVYSNIYAGRDEKTKQSIDETGKRTFDGAGLSYQLAMGKIPDWLKPVEYPLFGNMMLFEVREPTAKTEPEKPVLPAK